MIQPLGYFKIWRELFSKPIWLNSTPEHKTILITLLAMANFNDKDWEWKGNQFEVKKGQFITSLESIKENCGRGVTTQNIRSALVRFEKLGFLTNESTKTGRLVTIANWELYQSEENNQQSDQQRGNKEVTKSQQRGNKEVTPREEGKKDKNDKEGKKDNISYTEIANLYNSICSSFPKCTTLSEKRKQAIRARMNTYTVDDFKKLFKLAEASDFLKGNNDRDWQANFDWLIKDGNMAKVLDGNYTNRNKTSLGNTNEQKTNKPKTRRLIV